MSASENLRRELESIEGGIEDLQEILYRAEEDFRAVRPGWLQVLGLRMLKVDLERRVRGLRQRRDVVRNCHAEARKYEGWLKTTERKDERETAVR